MLGASSALAQVFIQPINVLLHLDQPLCTYVTHGFSQFLQCGHNFWNKVGGHLQLLLELSKSSPGPKNPNKENYSCTLTLTTYFWLNLKARVFSL